MKTIVRLFVAFVVGVMLVSAARTADATQCVWSGTGDWTNAAFWAGGILPVDGDGVLINSGAVLLTNSTPHLAYLTITNSTLTFTNWSTLLWADTVTLLNNGKMQQALCLTNYTASNTNRIYIHCSNLTVNVGGSIDVSQLGYSGGKYGSIPLSGSGPGGGASGSQRGGGGGHGGYGGNSNQGDPGGSAYDSASQPSCPGSGGGGGNGFGKNGGGAIWIQADGDVVVNGAILADGGAGWDQTGSGAGGSIYIGCRTINGAGTLRASGLSPNSNSGGGGGGRIAVNYDVTAQGGISPKPSITFSVVGGTGNQNGDLGTLWFPDTTIFSTFLPHSGEFAFPSTTSWAPASLTFSGGNIRFPTGFVVTVSSDCILTQTGLVKFVKSPSLTVGGNLLLTNSGALTIQSPPTNGTTPYGCLVSVTGSVLIATNCTLYPYSDPTNGGSTEFAVGSFTLMAGATVDANQKGYAGGVSAPGYGPGAGASGYSRGGGGGYGGKGGDSASNGGIAHGGVTNGSAIAPAACGSGGGGNAGANAGGNGGGLLWVSSTGPVILNGSVLANGGWGGGDQGGGGSGGGVYLTSPVFTGTGLVQANGGGKNFFSSNSGGGGGGRIAFTGWTTNQFGGSLSVTQGIWYSRGDTGTIYSAWNPSYPVTLAVSGNPLRHTVSAPYDYGVYAMNLGTPVTNVIPLISEQTASTRYICYGYNLTNDVGTVMGSSGDTQAVFTVNTNLTLVWNWTNQWYFTSTWGGNGGLLQDMTGWYTNAVQVTVTATAAVNYAFSSWTGVGVPPGSNTVNPLTVPIDSVRSFQANFVSTLPTPRSWNGTGVWLSATNWTPNGIPGTNDALTLQSGVCVLADPTAVNSVVVSNGATLLFTNWINALSASTVTVLSNGTITCAACNTNGAPGNSNRVNISCSTFTLNAYGLVDVNGKGYVGGYNGTPGQGPGAGGYVSYSGGGAGNGGIGATSAHNSPGGPATGSAYVPIVPGSGGGGGSGFSYNQGGNGGGAVMIQAANQMTINGTVRANGVTPTAGGKNGGGAGGSIYLSCLTLAGNGTIQANGGSGVDNEAGGAGGGRIAVVYDPVSQAALGSQPTVTFSVTPGPCTYMGQAGTVYLLNSVFFPDRVSDLLQGSMRIYGVTNWGPINGTVSNATLKFEDASFALLVTNKLLITASGTLDMTNVTASVNGNVLVTNSSTLILRSGPTNALAPRYGGLLDVAGDIALASNCSLYVWSHPTNGGSVRVHAQNLILPQGAQINADGTGYTGGNGPGRGGDSSSGSGGGYGGAGGAGSHAGALVGGPPYGTSNEVPLRCGSPGGRGGAGLFGPPGGLVWLELDSQLTLSGLITANGFPPGGLVPSGYGGGGSGGGIYIHCSVLVNTPSGVLQANGGKGGSESGGGGGGRINVWRLYQIGDKTYLGSVMYGQSNGNQSAAGSMGTTYWSMPAYSVFTVQ